MYKKIIFLIALIISQPFALTLEQIKQTLRNIIYPKIPLKFVYVLRLKP